MYRRDYIQRMLEELARALGKALGLKQQGRTNEALEQIREAYPSYFRIDAERVAEVVPEDLLTVFSGEFELKTEQVEALATVLMAEGEVLLSSDNNEEARDRFQKALILFKHVDLTDTANFSFQRKNNIARLNDLLGM